MDVQHTPGPWEVRLQPHEAPHIVAPWIEGENDQWQSGEDTICKLETLSDDGKPELGNAFLIAAAPELFAALVELVGWQSTAPQAVINEVNAAIAKARGLT